MTYELYHHGIKGQRWGIRRYQNQDGSYTKAGRKRYGLDLDINDKSRTNIAKIRPGEARRRLDTAKAKGDKNGPRYAELKMRERSAKRALREARGIDKGAKRIEKGETITGNSIKQAVAHGAAAAGSYALTNYLNKRLSDLSQVGRATPKHYAVASVINRYASYTMQGLAGLYSAKKNIDNANIRRYYNAKNMGHLGKKQMGSVEYADRVRREREAMKK